MTNETFPADDHQAKQSKQKQTKIKMEGKRKGDYEILKVSE